jgi:hypothetical protein
MVILSTLTRVAFYGVSLERKIVLDESSHYPAVNSGGYLLVNLFVIMGIATYLYSPRKLSINSLRRAARKWTCCERLRHHYHRRRVNTNPSGLTDGDDSVSVETSAERDIPSYSIALHAPYTNRFTDNTEIVSSHLIPQQSEYVSNA